MYYATDLSKSGAPESTLLCRVPPRFLQVRSAYRKKGWALTNTDHIEQCSHDGYLEAIKEQVGVSMCACVCVTEEVSLVGASAA